MAGKGSQYGMGLAMIATEQGDVAKDVEKTVKRAQAGAQRGARSGARGAATESSKGKRRFGNMMFEASRAAEDFGQQLSVSFDQAVRASANNITQMVAVSGNQYAAMATSVSVALYFMAKPLAELANLTRQWGEELAVVEDRIQRVKKDLRQGIQLRGFEQGIVAGLMPADQRPDQWETQKENLEEELADLRKRRTAIEKIRKDAINAPRDPRDMGFFEQLGAGRKTEKEQNEEKALMERMSKMSESELTRLETARRRFIDSQLRQQRGPGETPAFGPNEQQRRYIEEARKEAEDGRKEWQSELKELDLGEFADTAPGKIKKLTAELQKVEGLFKSIQREGRASVKIAEQEELVRKKLAIIAKHQEAIDKRRLAIDKERLDALREMQFLSREGSQAESRSIARARNAMLDIARAARPAPPAAQPGDQVVPGGPDLRGTGPTTGPIGLQGRARQPAGQLGPGGFVGPRQQTDPPFVGPQMPYPHYNKKGRGKPRGSLFRGFTDPPPQFIGPRDTQPGAPQPIGRGKPRGSLRPTPPFVGPLDQDRDDRRAGEPPFVGPRTPPWFEFEQRRGFREEEAHRRSRDAARRANQELEKKIRAIRDATAGGSEDWNRSGPSQRELEQRNERNRKYLEDPRSDAYDDFPTDKEIQDSINKERNRQYLEELRKGTPFEMPLPIDAVQNSGETLRILRGIERNTNTIGRVKTVSMS